MAPGITPFRKKEKKGKALYDASVSTNQWPAQRKKGLFRTVLRHDPSSERERRRRRVAHMMNPRPSKRPVERHQEGGKRGRKKKET